jgi:MFS transporter, DHA2 family, glioxin efflux transporter
MIYTLDLNSPASHWIGYQVLAGIGTGITVQLPVIVAQAISTRPDMSVTVGIALCKHQRLLNM